MHPRFSNFLLTTAALIALAAAPAAAGPQGPTVVGGTATIQGQGGPAVVVNQSSSSAIINWNTFNIGANESVRFNQPGSSSVVLNRVTGGLGPSEILGTLTANGRVFLINRDGILFGPSAMVNTAGFLATTHDIRDADFMAGRYNFNIPGRPDASIVNQGRITATSGGFATLVAPGVRNSGTITATLGTVALASSGTGFTLDLYGDKLITLAVNDQVASKVIDVATGRPLKSLVTNDGKIRANGGRVELAAAAARAVVDSVINTSGVIKANSIGRHNGMIVLSAATAGSKPAGAAAQTIKISGTLSAAGKQKDTQGGTILVSGEHIKLANARIDASGRAGGGKVLIGGDWGGGKGSTSQVSNPSAKLEKFGIPTATTVSVDAGTRIDASAKGRGNGGKVVLWSDSETTFAGTILARGGDGGFVEVSSRGQLAYSGTTDTRAPKGTTGTLLLDPENLYINANGSPPPFDPTASAISASTLVGQLSSTNVVLSTQPSGANAGDILVQSSVAWASDYSLTLNAHRNIDISDAVTISNAGAGNLVLRADSTGTGTGTVNFAQGTTPGRVDFLQSSGAVSIYYNPSRPEIGTKYQNPKNFLCSSSFCGGVFVNDPSQLTAYMLVNTASDLQIVNTAVTRPNAYALGRDIDAS
jgi:filamentous hemagglutinin family protein